MDEKALTGISLSPTPQALGSFLSWLILGGKEKAHAYYLALLSEVSYALHRMVYQSIQNLNRKPLTPTRGVQVRRLFLHSSGYSEIQESEKAFSDFLVFLRRKRINRWSDHLFDWILQYRSEISPSRKELIRFIRGFLKAGRSAKIPCFTKLSLEYQEYYEKQIQIRNRRGEMDWDVDFCGDCYHVIDIRNDPDYDDCDHEYDPCPGGRECRCYCYNCYSDGDSDGDSDDSDDERDFDDDSYWTENSDSWNHYSGYGDCPPQISWKKDDLDWW